MSTVHTRGLAFRFPAGPFSLRMPDLDLAAGQTLACIGPSGSGKSTFLGLLAGLLLPTAGSVEVDGIDWSRVPEARRRRERLTRVGQVFQEFALLDHLSVRENVLLPRLLGAEVRDAEARVTDLAERTGIADHLDRGPRELSHGERQRVAICRALLTRPALVLADEPTGNLDPRTAREVVDLLLSQARQGGATVVMVSHDHALTVPFDRVLDFARLAAEDAA